MGRLGREMDQEIFKETTGIDIPTEAFATCFDPSYAIGQLSSVQPGQEPATGSVPRVNRRSRAGRSDVEHGIPQQLLQRAPQYNLGNQSL